MKATQRKIICPECKSGDVALIFYGMPNPDYIRKIKDDQKIIFAGCCISLPAPKYHCYSCSYKWGKTN